MKYRQSTKYSFLNLFFLLTILAFSSCKNEVKKEVSDENLSGDATFDALSMAIDDDPQNDSLYFMRAQYLYETDRLDAAINDLREAITIDSMVPEYYHLLADAFLDISNSTRSLKTMEKASYLFPQRTPTLLKYAELQLILKQYDNSILTLNRILKYDPQNGEAYLMLGMNFREMGDTRRAINSFQTATEFDANIIDAWLLLGNIFEEQKKPEALKYYEAAVNVDPKNVSALHSKAFWLQNNNQVDKALDIYKEINLINDKYVDAYLNAGILHMERKAWDLAYEQFNILTKVSPTEARAYYFRGVIQEQRKNITEAKADYQNAINLNPEYEEAKTALEKLK